MKEADVVPKLHNHASLQKAQPISQLKKIVPPSTTSHVSNSFIQQGSPVTMDAFKNTPPITRTLAASVFVVSMLITCQLLDPSRLVFESPLVFKRFPEIWRFFTSFLLARNLEIIFVPYSSKSSLSWVKGMFC